MAGAGVEIPAPVAPGTSSSCHNSRTKEGRLGPWRPSVYYTQTHMFMFRAQVARWEQKTRKLSRAFRSPYLACYSLGAVILLLNILRSHCFTQAMLSQPKMESLDNPTAYRMGLVLLGVGSTFVLSSFFALGFTGTFLGKTPRAGGPRADALWVQAGAGAACLPCHL
ncbi:phosphatidylethanolamine N-methyltransferase [Leptonychotes weddellii]|uniref:Phosphatidylethanolamine N-methyltransferase n=1 Tax=Leptonychotes weddellii TaxID=9713 RepID=A0A2U3Z7P6_LEPWE|nr:phosphatidylethanolamine N-methyltransferase [Leptonychotes weddellii]